MNKIKKRQETKERCSELKERSLFFAAWGSSLVQQKVSGDGALRFTGRPAPVQEPGQQAQKRYFTG
ncbi:MULTISPECIES: hypothetical protein [Hungatella]|jgi:hypothetical protein|uniref:Uncharacterized protein n=1 Tax=Hungatella hathewayi TaxID=154046 RepID=A0A3E3DNP8_9FIRM|nr:MULTISPECIES: hypothetical protein [Hungatella]RGD70596.1 hypothetical protein DWX31_10070 [Hungatella hathewayi]